MGSKWNTTVSCQRHLVNFSFNHLMFSLFYQSTVFIKNGQIVGIVVGTDTNAIDKQIAKL